MRKDRRGPVRMSQMPYPGLKMAWGATAEGEDICAQQNVCVRVKLVPSVKLEDKLKPNFGEALI